MSDIFLFREFTNSIDLFSLLQLVNLFTKLRVITTEIRTKYLSGIDRAQA